MSEHETLKQISYAYFVCQFVKIKTFLSIILPFEYSDQPLNLYYCLNTSFSYKLYTNYEAMSLSMDISLVTRSLLNAYAQFLCKQQKF